MALVTIMYGYIAFDAIWDLIFTSQTIKTISEATNIPLQTIEDYLTAVQGAIDSIYFFYFILCELPSI